MANITFDAQDEKDQQTIQAIAKLFNYSTTIPDGNGGTTPNPVTQEQYAKKMTRKWWRELRREFVVIGAAESARQAALSSFNNGDPEEP